MRYWLSRGEGEVAGPFSAEDLAEIHARGELHPAGRPMPMVCAEGSAEWYSLTAVAELAWMGGGAQAGAPPTWPPPATPDRDPLRGCTLSFGGAFGLGCGLFQRNYGILLAATAIAIGVSVVGAVSVITVEAFARAIGGQPGLMLIIGSQLFNWVFNLLVSMPVNIGCLWLAIGIARGEVGSIKAIGVPFRHLWSLAAMVILLSVLMVLVAIPGLALLVGAGAMAFNSSGPGSVVLIVVAACLTIGPLIWIAVRLGPAYCLIIDPQASPNGPLGPIQAIVASWELTKGRTGALIAIGAVLTLMLVTSVMACIVPWIFVGNPLYLAVLGATYALLVHGREHQATSAVGER